MEKIDILAFGSHQDDVELGAGGTLLKMKGEGCGVGVISLTRSEMNSRTTPEHISNEANNASRILGTDAREILNLGDCKIEDTLTNRIIVADLIRKYRPDIVIAPYFQDRHTDHENTGKLIRSASVLSRLKKQHSQYPPHGPKVLLFYLLQVRNSIPPNLVVDISEVFFKKMEIVRCYRSQFEKTAQEQNIIPIGIGDYLFHIESRDRYYGSLINVMYGEAFVSESLLKFNNLKSLLL